VFPRVFDGLPQDDTCANADTTGADEFDEISAIDIWHRYIRLLMTGPAVEAVIETAFGYPDGLSIHDIVLFMTIEAQTHFPVIVLCSARIARLKIRYLSRATGKERGAIVISTMHRNPIHRFDGSMACLACDTRLHVSFVREVHEVGKIVNLDPWNGLFIFPVFGDLANQWALGRHFRMTSHAFVDAWDAR
jgi:hypothetical protein